MRSKVSPCHIILPHQLVILRCAPEHSERLRSPGRDEEFLNGKSRMLLTYIFSKGGRNGKSMPPARYKI